MKIHSVRAKMFHMDTDMMRLIVTCCNFANAANRDQHDLVSYEENLF
jgi:hypothetical protein